MSTTPIPDPPWLSTVQGEWAIGSQRGLVGRDWFNLGGGHGNFGDPIWLRSTIGTFSTNPSYWVYHNVDYVNGVVIGALNAFLMDQPQAGSGQVYLGYGGTFIGDGNSYIHILTTNYPSPFVPKNAWNAGAWWNTFFYYGGYAGFHLFANAGGGGPPAPDQPRAVFWGI